MDIETYGLLKALSLEFIDVWRLVPVVKPKGDWFLLSGGATLGTDGLGFTIDKTRTHVELCWTLASQFTSWMLGWIHPGADNITYLDADLYFFSNPTPVFAKIGERSIAITPHRLPEGPNKARLEKNGKYNVGFVYFRNTGYGNACLSRWAAQVRERCSAEVGCGDQVYLDSWESDYPGEVAILGHGINTGPWNLSAYDDVMQYDGQVFLGRDPLICYHFHEFQESEDGTIRLTNYPLRPVDKDLIYRPYLNAYRAAKERIVSVHLQT